MSTIKETMKEIINEQPEDSSFDEILRELAFARMIYRGLDDAEHGRTHSNEEIGEMVEQWRK